MQFDLGSASIVKNREFISIASRSYIKVIYDTENWLSLDVTDRFLGDEVLKACQRTHEYTMARDERGEEHPTNYEEWVRETKKRFRYKTDRAMFVNMENCQVDRFSNKIIIIPLVHMKLKAWGRRNSDMIEDIVLDGQPTPDEIGRCVKSVLEMHWDFYTPHQKI